MSSSSSKPIPPSKQPFDALAKVAVIGDSSVGKTNILLRYVNSQYQMTHITTIGIDFKVKTIVLDGFRLKMQIWDTAGQQRFRNLSGTIYQGAQAIILVYSVSSRKSFDSVQKWIQDITDKTQGSILLAIVGNKCDLKQQRQVTLQQGILIAKKFNAHIFMQTSAKQNINIQQLFEKVARKIKQKIQKTHPIQKKSNVQQSKIQQQNKLRSKTSNDIKQQTQSTVTNYSKNTQTKTNKDSKDNKVKLTTSLEKQKQGKKKKGCC